MSEDIYIVKLGYQQRENIFKKMLLEDWDILSKDIRNYKRNELLPPHQKEDLKSWKKYRKGFKKVIKYYFPHDEATKIIKGKGDYVYTEFDL
jgi:hypothetical protein